MPRTILIVDDEPSVREVLCFLVERRGYSVLLAENGPQGIELASRHQVDGALLDVHMPGMNGIVVCSVLRAQAKAAGRDIAIWMMTGARTTELAKAAEEAGALAMLKKPFNLEELYQIFEARFGPSGNPGTKS